MTSNQKLGLLFLIGVLSLTSAVNGLEPLNECERGVKRHHPSQANLYQVFTRKGYRKQWLDVECEDFMIFDPRTCACVESWTNHGEHEPNPDPKPEPEPRPDKYQSFKSSQEYGGRRNHGVEGDPTRFGEDSPSAEFSPKWGRRAGRKQDSRPAQRMADERNFRETSKEHGRDWASKDSHERTTEEEYNEGTEENCYLHRSSVSSPSQFERWTDGHWVGEDCNWPFYTGLVWSQQACRCEWGPNRTLAKPRLENMVPATCLMMLRMTFDKGQIKDEGRRIWLKLINKEEASVERDETAVGGYAGSFRGASVEVPYFKSNMLGSIFHIGLMFKLCTGEPDTSIHIVHNDCESSAEGASLVVSYQAWKRQITVAMRTTESHDLVEDYCVMRWTNRPTDGWIQMDIRYQDDFLEVTANGEICLGSDKYFGPLATNNCPLTLLGDSFCGLLDEVIVTRGCTSAHAVS